MHLLHVLFVILGQYYSEVRVFAWVLHLVFAFITPQFRIRHDYCTYAKVLYRHRIRFFGHTAKSRVWPIRHWVGDAHSNP